MAFFSSGEFRAVLQQYTYKQRKILCFVKIVPETLTLFKCQPRKDYNWITINLWAKVESSIWSLLDSIGNWDRDAPNIKTELVVDYIKVKVCANENLLSDLQKVLPAKDGLCLELTLEYMLNKNTNVVVPQQAKRKSPFENNNGTETSKPEKVPKSERRGKEERESRSTEKTKNKRHGRRSISQDPTKTNPIIKKESRGSSVETKTSQRPTRSPNMPSRFAGYLIGEKKPAKNKLRSTESSERSGKSTNKATIKKRRTSPSAPSVDINELKLLNEMLETPKPRKVEILLLKDMDEADVLKTFENYREHFDRVFKERQHKTETTSYMSIDHCHVMDILSKSIRDSMIKKLRESYSKSGPHCSLVINGLLPLWIIHLFMDKYNFTEDEAVRQLSDQLKYDSYLKAVNNEPLELGF
ncbi:CG4951 [Drosophila busckii]|uniref:CG4951 n=1 Tax=Drosophila busckii TaxID=30019 RepID=A0A0M5J2D3_DROBS|nr:uncharacterized protein CG4951 [Drosophila busckii]ALC47561.1 CG4951 [Drosophila busckii]